MQKKEKGRAKKFFCSNVISEKSQDIPIWVFKMAEYPVTIEVS